MTITLRQLRYFVEIAQSRSFSRAAERLRIAQPALSQNISSLEDTLGAKLFERHARGVEISPAGERLLTSAIDILARTDALKDDIDGRASLPTGVCVCRLPDPLPAPSLRRCLAPWYASIPASK
ncbi:LysR family transcriptional regulator [Cupriavidus basilensis]